MLLDTNALSAWANNDSRLFQRVPMDRPWVVSTITLGEYRYGLSRSVHREALERWLAEFRIEDEALSPTVVTARIYAEVRDQVTRAGKMIPYHDLWIAALAWQNNMPIVSHDGHFDLIRGARRIDWY